MMSKHLLSRLVEIRARPVEVAQLGDVRDSRNSNSQPIFLSQKEADSGYEALQNGATAVTEKIFQIPSASRQHR